MYIQVKLLKGFQEPLLYKVPADWDTHNLVGAVVSVPIRNRVTPALILKTFEYKPTTSFEIKEALEREAMPQDIHYDAFIHKISAYYQLKPIHFIKRMSQFLYQKEVKERMHTPQETKIPVHAVTLTDEQQHVCDVVRPSISTPTYMPAVLHGVTGSGKTEVYKNLITHALEHNKTALLLLPEVTLALQFEQLLKTQLPDVAIYSFHSATTEKHKRALWKNLLENKPLLIIGVHLPVLLPIPNLGLIIVDEEHEHGYQEKKHPKINSKEAAILRAHSYSIPIVLGSATPSLTTLHNVHTKGWKLFQLTKRFAGAFPKVKTVFLTDKKFRRNFWISQALEDALRDRLHKKEQAIIFLNRRGFSFFVQCKACSFTFTCNNCSVSLTLHNTNELKCHYCNITQVQPTSCPQCKADEKQLLKKGIGTQQVVSIIEKLFPHARVGRADLDTTSKKKEWHQTLHNFNNGSLDILVGTQTIAKGFHFPNVTLVGVLWADLNLHFPIYNAAETTLQQLVQVAGRAGRQRPNSDVIVQTMIDHPIFTFLNEQDYLNFYAHESGKRKMLLYPPYGRLVELELKHTHEETLAREADELVEALMAHNDGSIRILGPALPPVNKINNIFTRTVYLKATTMQPIIQLYTALDTSRYKIRIFFTPNPVS